MHTITPSKVTKVVRSLIIYSLCKGEVVVELVDMSSMKSVRACAERLNQSLEKVDILLNNAGVICPLARTEEGLEMIMATNHFGPFLLTNLLLPLLHKVSI